jgi:hypothetical protein
MDVIESHREAFQTHSRFRCFTLRPGLTLRYTLGIDRGFIIEEKAHGQPEYE